MPQFDWEFVGSVLLERERRPVLVLDHDGRIVRANRALHFFLEEGTRTHQVKFADDWVLPEARADFLSAWELALAGERPRLRVPIRPTAFHIEPIFELVPLSEGGQVRSVMLVMIDTVAAEPMVPLVPAVGLHYEVSVGPDARPEQLLRWMTGNRQSKVDGVKPCHAVLHGRATPCEQCPLTMAGFPPGAPLFRLESSSPFKASLVWSQRTRDDVMTISVMPVDEATYSGLVRTRVAALAERAKLSDRERHVFELLLMGRSLDDIALVEGITARTTKYHQQNLLRKLGAESRTDLFRLLS